MKYSQWIGCALAILWSGASVAIATTHTWGTGDVFLPGSSMSDPANWNSTGVPVSGSSELTLQFPRLWRNLSTTQNVSDPLVVQRLEFTGGGIPFEYSYVMQGDAYLIENLGASPSILAHSFTDFQAPIELAAPTTIDVGPGSRIRFANLTMNEATFTGEVGDVFDVASASIDGGSIGAAGHYVFEGGLSVAIQPQIGGTLVLNGRADMQDWNYSTPLPYVSLQEVVPGTNFAATYGTVVLPSTAVGELSLNSTRVDFATGSMATVENLVHGGGLNRVGGDFEYSSESYFLTTGEYSSGNGTIDLGGTSRVIDTTAGGTDSGVLFGSRVVNGSITKTGPGILGLYHSGNALTAPIEVQAGTLAGYADSLGSQILNHGTVWLVRGELDDDLISGPGDVRVGDVLFNVPQSYGGMTDVRGIATGTATTLPMDLTSAVNGEVVFAQNADGTYGGDFRGDLRVTKRGAGALGLSGFSSTIGEVRLEQGGLRLLSDESLGTGTLVVNSVQSATLEAVGMRKVSNALQLNSSLTIVGAGDLHWTSADLAAVATLLQHDSTGTTQIDGPFALSGGGQLTVNAGQLVLGDAANVNGFSAAGAVVLNGGVLQAKKLGFTTLANLTLAGGVLDVPGGYFVGIGSVLQGDGGLTGRVVSQEGAVIAATGDLVLGSASHPSGVDLSGDLYVYDARVTLNDANQAVLGTFTQIGTPAADGVLNAPNGMLLQTGRNLAGRGRIESTSSPAHQVILHGDVRGDSMSHPLEFTGYVTGPAYIDNVSFSGTYSPGVGAATTLIGRVALLPDAVLHMEIGGSLQGGEHDALVASAELSLGGVLEVVLVNSFQPSFGDEFHLLIGTLSGEFSDFLLPSLSSGLIWNTSQVSSQGLLRVGLAGDFNMDDRVDGHDFLTWQLGYPDVYAAADLTAWHTGFGGGAMANAAAVSEPSTLGAATLAACLVVFALPRVVAANEFRLVGQGGRVLVCRRRRRRKRQFRSPT